MLISQIVKFNYGETSAIDKDTILSSKIRYNCAILENDVVAVYRLYNNIYRQIRSAYLIETTIAYEDLSFNSRTDSVVFKQPLQVDSAITLTEKSASSDIAEYVLSQLPFLKTDLLKSLQRAGIPVTDDFCFLLGK